MKTLNSLLPWAPLTARVLVGGMFVTAGLNKLANFAATADFAQYAGLPSPEIAVTIAIAIEILGGLSIMLGYKIFWGAFTLAIFTVVVSFTFHGDFADPMQQLLFTKNMGIVAALLYMSRFGAGKMSVQK